jgi:Txe/YoeB family toxin of Txe-Axe toxin-antitoxin module
MIQQTSFFETLTDTLRHRIEASPAFGRGYKKFKKGKPYLAKKLDVLIMAIAEDPKAGRGGPEKLDVREFPGREFWSREISAGERLIYEIRENENLVTLLICGGHYENLRNKIRGYLLQSAEDDKG